MTLQPETAARLHHHLVRLIEWHLSQCKDHAEHMLVANGTTGLCAICGTLECRLCGGHEAIARPLTELYRMIEESPVLPGPKPTFLRHPGIAGYLHDLVKQGDAFNLKHSACQGGHHQHIH